MEMTRTEVKATAVLAALAIGVVLATLAVVPLAIAASSGSDYSMELIRAHTSYKTMDPPATQSVGLGVHGDR